MKWYHVLLSSFVGSLAAIAVTIVTAYGVLMYIFSRPIVPSFPGLLVSIQNFFISNYWIGWLLVGTTFLVAIVIVTALLVQRLDIIIENMRKEWEQRET